MVTASTVSDISLNVWDTLAYYPSSGAAFSDFTDTASTTSGDPTLCSKTYSVTISPTSALTTFSLDVVTKKFQIYSGDLSQIGTYTVTLTGAVTSATTQSATTTFTITVVDPCLTTTLIQPTPGLNAMQTSVLVQVSPGGSPFYATQQVGVFKD